MKVLCGTDIIEISRIKSSIERTGDRFLNLIYTPKEIEYCESKKNAKFSHYAGRFAAKEAIFKAVSSLLKDKFEISWHNAEVLNDKYGNPKIEFRNVDNDNFKKIESIDISISHSRDYAVASVVVIVND